MHLKSIQIIIKIFHKINDKFKTKCFHEKRMILQTTGKNEFIIIFSK